MERCAPIGGALRPHLVERCAPIGGALRPWTNHHCDDSGIQVRVYRYPKNVFFIIGLFIVYHIYIYIYITIAAAQMGALRTRAHHHCALVNRTTIEK